MGYVYIDPPIYGFRLHATEGALRVGRRSRPEIVPTRLLDPEEVLDEAKRIRDTGDLKWAGTKGGEDFHRDLLTILNYLVKTHKGGGIQLYYDGGHRGTAERLMRPILSFNPMPAEAGDRLSFLEDFVECLQFHYSSPETFSPSQCLAVLNFIATIVSQDSEMISLIVMA